MGQQKQSVSKIYTNPVAEANKEAAPEHKMIAAEEVFDWTTYGVFNYGIQTTIAAIASREFQHGIGKEKFDKAAQVVGKNLIEKITSKTGAEAVKWSHSYIIFASLIVVGSLFIPPVKWLENRKAAIVDWTNDTLNFGREMLGGHVSNTEKQEQQQAIEEIRQKPTQSWGSLWAGRGIGLLGAFGANYIIGEDRNIWAKGKFAGGAAHVADAVGAKNLAKSEKFHQFAQIAFLDYAYSTIVASGVYVYSHFVHPDGEHEKAKPEKSVQPAAPTQEALPLPYIPEDHPLREEQYMPLAAKTPKANWRTHLDAGKAAKNFTDLVSQSSSIPSLGSAV